MEVGASPPCQSINLNKFCGSTRSRPAEPALSEVEGPVAPLSRLICQRTFSGNYELRLHPGRLRQFCAHDRLTSTYPHFHCSRHDAMFARVVHQAQRPVAKREGHNFLLAFSEMHALESL